MNRRQMTLTNRRDRSVTPRKFSEHTRSFYLVQGIKRSHRADNPAIADTPLGNLRNPFGYGHMGDYDLEYMGSAEFEFGAIPKAFNRLADAGKGLTVETKTYNGHDLDFLWIEKEGDPYDGWCEWAAGTERTQPFYGKERPYQLEARLKDEPEPSYGWRTDVWWALDENIMWAFTADGHLQRMIESMQGAKVALRG